ncbi:cache domain-containing protein [Motilimonas cestriensis]|uniref:cache domain-containing protein n=1 Tax=Motilimonas cestriensis TaxID=2742685 RepID=UPI003DA44490
MLSIVPFSTISILFLYSYSKDLTLQTTSHLVSVREIKKSQVRDYFRELKQQASLFSQSDFAKASIGRFYGFSAAFERLGPTIESARVTAQQLYEPGGWDKYKAPEQDSEQQEKFKSIEQGDGLYKRVHLRYHKEYAKLVRESDFSDILLVDETGNVVYSVTKQANWGTNLINGQYKTTSLADSFQKLKIQMDQVKNPSELYHFSDFALNPLTNEVVAYLSLPIMQHSYVRGVIIFEISNKGLNALMSDREGLGKTGETFIVGSDNKLRSDLSLTPEYSVFNSFTNSQYTMSSPPYPMRLMEKAVPVDLAVIVKKKYWQPTLD